MQIKFIYPRWGSTDIEWPIFLDLVKKNGYDGIEIDLPLEKKARNKILDLLKDFDLKFIGQHWETKEIGFKAHKEKYRTHLYNLAEASPLLINSHTGMDFFSFEQNKELLIIAGKIEDEVGVKITHETHRSRFSFAAHSCHAYLKELPFLKLTADFSHWCCVAETLLENQEEAVKKAIAHTHHIHARVGSSQSAQVIDPRDSNYTLELDQFKKWWVAMLQNAKNNRSSSITITPEYGPHPYSLYHKDTTIPLENQWEINQFIKKEILEAWEAKERESI
ncbi:sugar phosphate isomerase/epimerase family protein [Maribacter sp. HTCC2170]|uniref:sugar phosphate isomerase/epimerase family protein n=1 Tax=Maribacter sp. (strain HTCC2170 / KCCM 42371) TaxID=313603 RepID=UPI00006BD2A3|nr:sugar phosphate isomerase/epimerase [Maribacter sp. HTCC2170]EAR02344.1 hypothetical protein FB2170_03635 [Maribacter sp. HTCC2170]